MTDDYGATVNDWLSLVRRTRLGRSVKLVSYYLAGRANADGTHLFPGVSRTAVECELSTSAVRVALAKLRKVGLLKVVKRGNRRRGLSDEYRLTIHAELPERITVPTPDEHAQAIANTSDRTKNRERQRLYRERRKASNATQAGVTETSDITPVQSGVIRDEPTSTQTGVTSSNNATFVTGITPSQNDAHPSLSTLPVSDPPSPADRSSSTTRSQRAWDDCPDCHGSGWVERANDPDKADPCGCKQRQRAKGNRRSRAGSSQGFDRVAKARARNIPEAML